MGEDFETRAADSTYHRRLPIGETVDATTLTEGDRAAFSAVTMAHLAPMRVPERPRSGAEDRAAWVRCRPAEHTIWPGDLWQVRAGRDRMGIPSVGGLAPRPTPGWTTRPVSRGMWSG